MARPTAHPAGTISNLGRLVRSALTFDALLATGRTWQQVEEEVRVCQYEARGYQAPSQQVVRRYFMLDLAPALDPGPTAPIGYPAAVALQYPEVRPMVVAPIVDLLFGVDRPKSNQQARKERFSDRQIAELERAGRRDDADFMRLLNEMSATSARGRPRLEQQRPLWSLYQTLLACQPNLVQVLFEKRLGAFHRHIRPIEDELEELLAVRDIDTLSMLYGLMLEGVEISDAYRVEAAKEVLLAWLPALEHVPACRRVHPILIRAVRQACLGTVARRFCRAAALDRIRPPSWRAPGPFVDTDELFFRDPGSVRSIDFFAFRDIDLQVMDALIEDCAKQYFSVGLKLRRREVKGSAAVVRLLSEVGGASLIRSLQSRISARLPRLQCWGWRRFWVLQIGTRCAVLASGHESVPLLLVEFDFLRGDPVVDRPVRAMPWMLAGVLDIDADPAAAEVVSTVAEFLESGVQTEERDGLESAEGSTEASEANRCC